MFLKEIMISKPQIIKEQDNQEQNKTIKFKLNLIECDKPGFNRRIYPKEEVQKQVNQLESKLKNRQLLGELDHPTGDDERTGYIYIKEQSHLITDLKFNGNVLEGTIEVLNTPNGNLLMSVLKQDVQIGQSLRQVGELYLSTNNTYVQRNLDIITWDIVQNPSYDITYFTKEQLVENINYMLKHRYKKLFEGQRSRDGINKLVELVSFKVIDDFGLTIDDDKLLNTIVSLVKEEVERIVNIKG